MTKTIQALSVLNILVFGMICVGEKLCVFDFGISRGTVLEVKNTGVTCFGSEYEYNAFIQMEINGVRDIPIKLTHLSNELVKDETKFFIYWGRRQQIQEPISLLEPEGKLNSNDMYDENLQISLLSYKSPITWYFLLFHIVKWSILLTGIFLGVQVIRS